jgi:multidrug efflux pump subunit AcrA (membrane-fusion protein)
MKTHMQILFAKHFLRWVIFLLILALAATYYVNAVEKKNKTVIESMKVVSGTVSETVTVSGKIEAKDIARLNFPRTGVIQHVYKKEGDQVKAGEILASLTKDSIVAEYNSALQNLKLQQALRNEIVRGPRHVAREVTNTQLSIAEDNVIRIKSEQEILVKSALEKLLSSDLEAIPVKKANVRIPPSITGNYQCQEEGTYIISAYSSMSPTAYSYNLSGLEKGTFVAYVDTPAALGSCGLMVKFDNTERYSFSEWTVTIPNKNGANYLSNYNAYQLALQQQKNAVEAAEQAFLLALNTEKNLNAPASSEALAQANARVAEAEAQLALRESYLADYSIKAPFDGTLTNFDIKVGELANTAKNITIIKEGAYTLQARVPEIDIRKIEIGNKAKVKFDASPNIELAALVVFISPLSTEIGGVSYYDTDIELDTEPNWLREGLNADVEIITRIKNNVPVLPKRFLIYESDGTYVLQGQNGQTTKRAVNTGLTGTNGLVEILDLTLETEVLLP